MCKIFLENNIIKNRSITDNGILAYVGLRMIVNNKKNKDYVLYDYIVYSLCGSFKSDKLKKCIKNGISELEQLGLIRTYAETNLGKELDLSGIVFNVKDQNHSSDNSFKYFTTINQKEILVILSSQEKYKIKILRYFICMISTLNHSRCTGETNNQHRNIGSRSIQFLSEIANISKDAVIHYNKFLEDNHLIYICRSEKFVSNNNGIIERSFTNCYGRPEDKYFIDVFQFKTENRYNANNGIKLLSDNVNTKRSMKMKINQLKRGKGLNYSLNDLRAILTYMENTNYNAALRKQKDIFSKVDLDIVNERIMKLDNSAKEGDGELYGESSN